MQDEKISFWKTPEGKILNHGIHEYNSGTAYIGSGIKFINFLLDSKDVKIIGLDKNDAVNKKLVRDFYRQLEMISKGRDKCRESIDYIYTEMKKLKGY